MRKFPSSQPVRQRARELRQEMTDAEKVLWAELRSRRLNNMKFRRQHPIGRFIVDFYCAENRLIVEVDGPIHEQQVERDQARTDYLHNAGFQVVRFRNDEVLGNMAWVLKKIAAARGGSASLP